MENLNNPTTHTTISTNKFYSMPAILMASYLGSPMAASFLIRRNYINVGKNREGSYALVIGIIATALILTGCLFIPEEIIDKIPNILIPAIYTTALFPIAEHLQGYMLREHKASEGAFYSIWRAVWIALVAGIAMVAVIFIVMLILLSLIPDLADMIA